MDEHVVPERCGSRGDRDLRESPRQKQVPQVAEEDAMARFQFDQQPETRCAGSLDSLVCDQNRRGFFHGYTPEGGKVAEL